MGCQILDDMTDLKLDISMHRHNYLASLIVHTAPHTRCTNGSYDCCKRRICLPTPSSQSRGVTQSQGISGIRPQGAVWFPGRNRGSACARSSQSVSVQPNSCPPSIFNESVVLWGTALRYLWRSRHSTGTLAVMIFLRLRCSFFWMPLPLESMTP